MVKLIFIESKLKKSKELSESEIEKIPKKIFLAYSIQYKLLAEKIKKQLEDNKIKVTGIKQVLGCSKINTKDPVLFIGAGEFHALNLFLQAKSIFMLNNNGIMKFSEEEIERLKNKRRAALIKYLDAENLGIVVSTKPGQENIEKAITLRKKINKKGKKAYIFLSNNINPYQFENFNIDSWINTACIGLSYDNPAMINLSEISDN